MRFASIVLSGLFAVVAAAQGTETTAAPPTTVSVDPAIQSQTDCLAKCNAGDVNCQAHCISVPSPNESQVNATTECAAKCNQGDGTAAQTEAYAKCIDKCINDHYFVSSQGTPQATGGAGGGSNGGSGSGGSGGSGASPTSGGGSGSGGSGSSKTSGTKTGSTSTTTATHNAAPMIAGSAMLGLMGAIFAL
ncbi:hypothetical protein PT974_08919 [Cladobotryum mycophilum]|uniref:Extracellular membrane protein CFEM domain-containing protein n=1 Tax=Cladobotryum mycophilum TaxID=491253 RepID=A0ABR0SFW2_9HYPO